jgi:hypothetical protein
LVTPQGAATLRQLGDVHRDAPRLVAISAIVLLIPVPFRRRDYHAGVHAQGDRVGVLSFLSFIPIGVFDEATIRSIGHAFDAACRELHDTGQPAVVHEVMIKRIVAAAQKGERNATRLRDAALTGLRKPRNQISSQVALSGGKPSTGCRRGR